LISIKLIRVRTSEWTQPYASGDAGIMP